MLCVAEFDALFTPRLIEQPPLDCPISAFGGERDDEVSMPDLYAWKEETTSSFTVHTFQGDHFFINTDREAVLHALEREFVAIESRHSGA